MTKLQILILFGLLTIISHHCVSSQLVEFIFDGINPFRNPSRKEHYYDRRPVERTEKPKDPLAEMIQPLKNGSISDSNNILVKPVIFPCPVGQTFSRWTRRCVQPVLLKHPVVG
ncbi:hypothetical protein Fcan01_21524 [Folsomia candida]|uniref:Uncharacterized protein n=1 Tax=Folsomia candida TaxID=158441 RepID=A0A226DFY5_FOLCA|nr:hypothetical protein Fcan01_21524 [Folsomia candida]